WTRKNKLAGAGVVGIEHSDGYDFADINFLGALLRSEQMRKIFFVVGAFLGAVYFDYRAHHEVLTSYKYLLAACGNREDSGRWGAAPVAQDHKCRTHRGRSSIARFLPDAYPESRLIGRLVGNRSDERRV